MVNEQIVKDSSCRIAPFNNENTLTLVCYLMTVFTVQCEK